MELKDLLARTQYILEDLELIEELLDTNKLKEARDLSLQANFGIEKINDDLNSLDDDLNSLIDSHNKIDIKANDINRKMKLINENSK